VLNGSRILPASVDAVEIFCLALRRELSHGWLKSDAFAAELVIREVLANAIEHGAGLDPLQNIVIQLSADGKKLVARVSDQGAGFDLRAVSPDPAPDRGRGLSILNQYASVHVFEDGGRTVTFELPLRAESSASQRSEHG
jgi:anti-sigma regulatory factor (Ser/Thr protein kinase)